MKIHFNGSSVPRPNGKAMPSMKGICNITSAKNSFLGVALFLLIGFSSCSKEAIISETTDTDIIIPSTCLEHCYEIIDEEIVFLTEGCECTCETI